MSPPAVGTEQIMGASYSLEMIDGQGKLLGCSTEMDAREDRREFKKDNEAKERGGEKSGEKSGERTACRKKKLSSKVGGTCLVDVLSSWLSTTSQVPSAQRHQGSCPPDSGRHASPHRDPSLFGFPSHIFPSGEDPSNSR